MFTAVIRDETALGRPASAATLHRIHATLRAALNGAVRAGLISVNPGRYPELPRAARPRPQVWTPGADRALAARRLAASRRGVDRRPDRAVPAPGARSPAVRAVPPGRAARAAPRRGRRAAVERPRPRRRDADRDRGSCSSSAARLVAGPPKSDAGRRVIALDKTTIAALREHRLRQQAERAAAGTRWAETGYVFTTEDREAGRAGPDDPPVPRAGRRLRAAAGHAARAAARRRHPRPGRGSRQGDCG